MANKHRLLPKHKHEKPSWLKRNKAREVNQEVYRINEAEALTKLANEHHEVDHDALAAFAGEGNPHHD